ncbi:MAG: hypothetical protein ACE5GV_09645 [Candidatus Scalindua sp.]
MKRKIAVFVGSGFSAALTSGSPSPIGARTLPTLTDFSGTLLDYLKKDTSTKVQDSIPFSNETIDKSIKLLEKNELESDKKYDFEQFLSIIATQNNLLESGIFSGIIKKDNFSKDILDCLIFFIPRLLADILSLDGKLKKNRNLFYAVNNADIVRLIQTKIWEFCDENDVSFISFNYDGLIEAFLDCDLTANQRGEKPIFRYFPEISHGCPFVKY